jgi:hypothetical protein
LEEEVIYLMADRKHRGRKRSGIIFKGTHPNELLSPARLHLLVSRTFPNSYQLGTKCSTHKPVGVISYSNLNSH